MFSNHKTANLIVKNLASQLFWVAIALCCGVLASVSSSFFLVSLHWVTDTRISNQWLLWFLPLGGLLIGLTYHVFGKEVVAGNNLLLEEFHAPKKTIKLRMAPLVLWGTLLTHLVGGSAGREGTAVQMAAALSDQFSLLKKFTAENRKILISCGIAAGFSSVFGTPLAGAVFALEVTIIGRVNYDAILPVFVSAIAAFLISEHLLAIFHYSHTLYLIDAAPDMTAVGFLLVVMAGILFGLTASVFAKSAHYFSHIFNRVVQYAPFRPMIGGAILALIFLIPGSEKFQGLGVPEIQKYFQFSAAPWDFAVKLLLTTFTLGAGFKGGEVTPLFFIGAALGSALSLFLPLPIWLLAALGFVGVFSGATNTPIACTLMGLELFGIQPGVYIALTCVVAYIFSGHTGIYSSQKPGMTKIFSNDSPKK